MDDWCDIVSVGSFELWSVDWVWSMLDGGFDEYGRLESLDLLCGCFGSLLWNASAIMSRWGPKGYGIMNKDCGDLCMILFPKYILISLYNPNNIEFCVFVNQS